jgi:hypothetical protein
MISTQPRDAHHHFYDTTMPKPVIPTRHMHWFPKALWVLALLLVVGLAYSFWRISNVASPRLDVPPQGPSTDTARPG